MESILLIVLGLFAGGVTTLAGVGGGLMMTLILASQVGPAMALTLAAPALLLGNLHRVLLFRADLDWKLARPLVLGGVVGALIGGAITLALPQYILQGLIIVAMALSIARQFGLFNYRPGPRALLPLSGLSGFLAATSGGGGLILGPLLLVTGARGGRFVATASVVAGSIHVARIVAYGSGGWVTKESLLHSLLLGIAIIAGNAIAKVGRRFMNEKHTTSLTYAALGVCVIFTLVGLA